MADEVENIEGLWRMYNKAKESLPYKARMENLTWRMMYITNKRLEVKKESIHIKMEHEAEIYENSNNVPENSVSPSLDPAAEDFDYVAHIRKMGQNNLENDAGDSEIDINNDDSNDSNEAVNFRKRPADFSPMITSHAGPGSITGIHSNLSMSLNQEKLRSQIQNQSQSVHPLRTSIQPHILPSQHLPLNDLDHSDHRSQSNSIPDHHNDLYDHNHDDHDHHLELLHVGHHGMGESSAFEFSLDPLAFEGPNNNYNDDINMDILANGTNSRFDDMEEYHTRNPSLHSQTIGPTSILHNYNDHHHSNSNNSNSNSRYGHSNSVVSVVATPTNLLRHDNSIISLPDFSHNSASLHLQHQQPPLSRSITQTPTNFSRSSNGNDTFQFNPSFSGVQQSPGLDFPTPQLNNQPFTDSYFDSIGSGSIPNKKGAFPKQFSFTGLETETTPHSLPSQTTLTSWRSSVDKPDKISKPSSKKSKSEKFKNSSEKSKSKKTSSPAETPRSLGQLKSSQSTTSLSSMQPGVSCTNCHTQTTPLWRRNPQGLPLCNACGLFLKLHGVVRPLSLKTDVIKKRQRNTNPKKSISGSSKDKDGDDLNPTSICKSDTKIIKSLVAGGSDTSETLAVDGEDLKFETPILLSSKKKPTRNASVTSSLTMTPKKTSTKAKSTKASPKKVSVKKEKNGFVLKTEGEDYVDIDHDNEFINVLNSVDQNLPQARGNLENQNDQHVMNSNGHDLENAGEQNGNNWDWLSMTL